MGLLKIVIKSYIWLRNTYIYNFNSNMKAVIARKNNIYYSNFWWFIFRILPFCILDFTSRLLNFNIIYESDNIINITNIPKTLKIMPIITNFKVHLTNGEIINLKYYIKQYNSNIPVKFFLKDNNINLDNVNRLEVNYIKSGILRTHTYNEYDNFTLYDIFT